VDAGAASPARLRELFPAVVLQFSISFYALIILVFPACVAAISIIVRVVGGVREE
jgi:hypothetical protein